MTLARPHVAAVLATILAASAFADMPALAQPDGGATWLCRIHFHDEGYGGDTTTTDGVVELTRAAPQADGSIVYMGQGRATATYSVANPNCIVRGSPFTTTVMGIVESADGRTANVDIMPNQPTFPIAVVCGPDRSELEAGISVPESVSLPLQDGATAAYEVEHHAIFAHGGSRGTVRLEYCRPS